MQFGHFIEAGKTIYLENNRRDFPVLIIGREAKTTLQKLFLEEPTAYFGSAQNLLPHISRPEDVILFELNDDRPIGFNPFKDATNPSDTATDLIDGIASVYQSDIATTRVDRFGLVSCLALLLAGNTNLFQLPYLFTSKKYRRSIINRISDPVIRYELERFDGMTTKDQDALSESILNRMTPLITDPMTRIVLAQLRTIPLTPTTILLVDMPDSDRAALLASLILSRLKGQVYIERPLLHVGQSVPVLACEYLDQLSRPLKDKLLGTASLMSFRLGIKDAEVLAPYFNLKREEVSRKLLTELADNEAYVRLDDTVRVTVTPHAFKATPSNERRIRARSRSQYGTPKEVVDDHVKRFLDGL